MVTNPWQVSEERAFFRTKQYVTHVLDGSTQFIHVGSIERHCTHGAIGHAGFVTELQFLSHGFCDNGKNEAVDLQHQMRQGQQHESVQSVRRGFVPPSGWRWIGWHFGRLEASWSLG